MDPSAFSKSVARANGDPARDGRLPPNAAPSAQGKFAADPADLVVRALAILAEDSFTNDETRFPSRAGASAELRTPSVGLPLERRVLSDGTECPLPIRYFDVQCLVATFLAELDRAAELLGGTGLKAVSQEDGKAVVAVYCIEYRKTDIGPYNEVGLTVLALGAGRSDSGTLRGRSSRHHCGREPRGPRDLGLQQVCRRYRRQERRQEILDALARFGERNDRRARG